MPLRLCAAAISIAVVAVLVAADPVSAGQGDLGNDNDVVADSYRDVHCRRGANVLGTGQMHRTRCCDGPARCDGAARRLRIEPRPVLAMDSARGLGRGDHGVIADSGDRPHVGDASLDISARARFRRGVRIRYRAGRKSYRRASYGRRNLFVRYARRHVRRSSRVSTSCLPRAIKVALARVTKACRSIAVISTFRRNAVIAGTRRRSYHASCRAADFTTKRPACAYRALAGWWPGGLSNDYGRVKHFHLDNGQRLRFAHGRSRTRYAKRGKRRIMVGG